MCLSHVKCFRKYSIYIASRQELSFQVIFYAERRINVNLSKLRHKCMNSTEQPEIELMQWRC